MGRERISYVIENPDMYTYWKSHKSTLDLENFENSKVRSVATQYVSMPRYVSISPKNT